MPGLFAWLCGAPALRAEGPTAETRTASESALTVEQIEVGYRGFSKVGEATPLWVTLKSPDDRRVSIAVDAPDPDDNLASFPARTVELKSGVPLRIETCFRTGRLNGDLQVRVDGAEGHRLATRRLSPSRDSEAAFHPPLKLDTPLWVALGRLELPEPDAAAGGNNPQLVTLDSPEDLPTDPGSLESVDMLILPTRSHTTEGRSPLSRISADGSATLQNWVRSGGHLVISLASQVAEYANSPLAAWNLPFKVEGQFPVRQLSALESYSGLNVPLRLSGTIAAARLSKVDQANVLVRDSAGPQPLIASAPLGFGRVTMICLDLDAPPLTGWNGLGTVLQRVSRAGASQSGATARKANRQLTHVGVSDLATQLQQTHEDFPSVTRPSYWAVMGMILLYVAVIGPLDYVLVHRVLRRPELTWLTLVAMVAGGVALAAWTAQRANGSALAVNQFDLVDIDAASGTTRHKTWTSLYSPEHRRYSVAVEPIAASAPQRSISPVAMSWLGAPENSVGGLYRSAAGGLGGRAYRFAGDDASVENVPVAHWSTKSLSASWTGELETPAVDCHLESLGTGQLRGSLTWLLDEPLEDCMLVASGWAYIPTTPDAALRPGVEWLLRGDQGVRQRDLKALLTGEKQTRRRLNDTMKTPELTTTIEPYQPLGRNRSQQVAMITFHEATGGSSYTGLSNAALRHLELTDLMQLGRAVLIGRRPAPPARVVVDGAPVQPASQATWVRVVLPVAAKDRVIEKSIPNASERRTDLPPTGNKP